MSILFSSLSGILFGLGLLVSGMSDPAKVLGFLDITHRWDPSLVFVMAGAVAIAAPAFRIVRSRRRPFFASEIVYPTTTRPDRRLIAGSVLFGTGWGIAGICPGPALVLTGSGITSGGIFLAAMLAGMLLFEWFEYLIQEKR